MKTTLALLTSQVEPDNAVFPLTEPKMELGSFDIWFASSAKNWLVFCLSQLGTRPRLTLYCAASFSQRNPVAMVMQALPWTYRRSRLDTDKVSWLFSQSLVLKFERVTSLPDLLAP